MMATTTSRGFSTQLNSVLRNYGIVLVFLILVLVLTFISPDMVFASPKNLVTVLKQTAINGILAMGMMFVITSGGIDLSVGSIVALSGVVAAMFAHPGEFPLFVPILAAAAAGALVGLFNGVSVAIGWIPPFIVTLGTMTMVRGLALITSGGVPISNVSSEFEAVSGLVGPVPLLAVYFAVVVVICAFVLNRTVFGRHVYAVGGNEVAAQVSGVSVRWTKIGVYTISGLLAGICGMLNASRTITGAPNAGVSYELDAIAAVVIGGVSMSGGLGKWYGVVVGALLIAVMGNGLDLLGVDSNYQQVVKGLIIILAVFWDIRGKRSLNVST
jgi:ribose/xylose/arabinose/galactoside ABC-type transport system permease subunit